MTFLVPEDSYLTLEEANSYHAYRTSKAEWIGLSDEEKQQRLVSASDFLDIHYRFLGQKRSPYQPRQFPRTETGGVDRNGIPTQIKHAICELALFSDLNKKPKQKMSSVRVGPVTVNYEQNELSNSADRFPNITKMLDLFLDKTGRSGKAKLIRG